MATYWVPDRWRKGWMPTFIGVVVVLCWSTWVVNRVGLYLRWRDSHAVFVAENAPKVAALFGGESGVDVVRHPDRVKATRVVRADESKSRIARLGDVAPLSPVVEVAPRIAEAISEDLLSPYTYEWGAAASTCRPEYLVQITFERGGRRREVLLDFACRKVLVFGETGDAPLGSGVFDYAAAKLAVELKKLFPNDPAVQSLSTKSGKSPASRVPSPF